MWEGATAKKYTIYAGNDNTNIAQDDWGTAIVNETSLERSGGDKNKQYDFDPAVSYRYLKFVANDVESYNDKGWNVKIKEIYIYNDVTPRLTTLSIDTDKKMVKKGNEVILSNTAKDQFGHDFVGATVTYQISPASAGTIEGSVFTPTATGIAELTALSGDIVSPKTEVWVHAGEKVDLYTNWDTKVEALEGTSTESKVGAFDDNLNSIWELHGGTAEDEVSRTYEVGFIADLGSVYNISEVSLWFEGACSQEYDIYFAGEDKEFSTAAIHYSGAYGTMARKDYYLSSDINGNKENIRYVKFVSAKAATGYGVKLYDFAVYQSSAIYPTVLTPTQDAENVTSIYGSFYTAATTMTKANWTANSGQDEEVQDANNKVMRHLTDVDYMGYEYNTDVDITGKNYLHVDIYPVSNTTQASIDIITGKQGQGAFKEIYSNQTGLTVGEWNSIDIPLGSFVLKEDDGHVYTRQFKIAKDRDAVFGDGEKAEFYVTNIYYYYAPAVIPAPTEPTYAAENVAVVYSNTYGRTTVADENHDPNSWGTGNFPAGMNTTLHTSSYTYMAAEGNHQIVKVTGYGANGRLKVPNTDNTTTIADYQIMSVAIYPTTATKATLFADNLYSAHRETVDVIPGQWNYVSVPYVAQNDDEKGKDYLVFVLTKDDGTEETEFYFDHWIMVKDNVTPVLNTAALLSVSPVSATLSLKATDDVAANVNYVIVVKKDGDEGEGTTYTTTGANAADITYTIKGLELNTPYTATVTANDGANSTESKTVTFTTETIPAALAPNKTGIKAVYLNRTINANGDIVKVDGDNENITALNITGGDKETMEVAKGDNVVYLTGPTQFVVLNMGAAEEIKTADYDIGNFCIYPTLTTNKVTVTVKFYGLDATVSKEYEVTPNQWNYITFKINDFKPEGYVAQPLTELRVAQAEGNPIFFDNYYYVANKDVNAPVYASDHVNAAASYVVFTLNYTDNTESDMLVYKIWNEFGGYEGDVAGLQGTDVRFRINNLDPGKTYNYTLKVYDQANNESVARSLTATTPTVTGDLRVNDAPNDPEADRLKAAGMVYLTGVWDKDKFIAIDQQYCATAYDLTEVDFTNTGDARLDRDQDYFTFNPNAILVSPKLNKFNINYVMYERDGVTLTAFNFDMRDGDFKAATYYANNPMKEMILDGIDNLATYKYKNGLDAGGYLKLDPFTGFKKIITGQNFAFSRNITDGDGKGADKFGTVVLPFPVNIAESNDRSGIVMELYHLNTAEKDAQGNINLKFEQVEGVSDMNTPYLIKSTAEAGGGTIYFIDNNVPKALNFPEGNKEAMKEIAVSNDNGVELFGSYITYEAESNGKGWDGYPGYYHSDIYGLPGGNTDLTLYNMAAGSILPAWRAAVKVSDVAEGAKITMEFVEKPAVTPEPEDGEETDKPGEGTETTKITRPATDEEIQAVLGNVYSIDGRQVRANKNPYLSLPAGIYIVNGKKVVVK